VLARAQPAVALQRGCHGPGAGLRLTSGLEPMGAPSGRPATPAGQAADLWAMQPVRAVPFGWALAKCPVPGLSG